MQLDSGSSLAKGAAHRVSPWSLPVPLQDVWPAIALFLLSLCLTAFTWERVTWWTGDSFQYLRLGENLLAGRGQVALEGTPNFFFLPVYPVAVALLDLILRSPVTSGRVISALGSAFSVAALFLVARRWFSTPVVLLGSALYLCLPLRIWSSSWVMTEGLYCGLVWGAVLTSTAANRAGSVAAGLLGGLASLTRPEGMLYLPMVLALQFLTRSFNARLTALRSAVTVAAFLSVVLPYLVCVYSQTGQWMSAGRLEFNLTWAHAQDLGVPLASLTRFDEQRLQPELPDFSLSWQNMVARYTRNAHAELQRLTYLLGPSWLTPGLLLLGLLGTVAATGSDRRRRPRLLQQLLLCAPLLALPLLFISDRLMLSSLPLMSLWLAQGACLFADWVTARLDSSFWRLGVIAAVAAVLALSYSVRVTTVRPEVLSPTMEVGQLLREDALDAGLGQATIMASDPAVAYFAGLRWVAPPAANLPSTLRYARELGATYLVIRREERFWEGGRELWQLDDLLPGLVPVPSPARAASFEVFRVVGDVR